MSISFVLCLCMCVVFVVLLSSSGERSAERNSLLSCVLVCLSSNMIMILFSFIYLQMNRVSFKCWSVLMSSVYVFIRVMFCVVLVSSCDVSSDCIRCLSFVYLSFLFDIINVIQSVLSFYLDENHFLCL